MKIDQFRACDFCRKKKVKCILVQNQCQNCLKQGIDCSYEYKIRKRGPKLKNLDHFEDTFKFVHYSQELDSEPDSSNGGNWLLLIEKIQNFKMYQNINELEFIHSGNIESHLINLYYNYSFKILPIYFNFDIKDPLLKLAIYCLSSHKFLKLMPYKKSLDEYYKGEELFFLYRDSFLDQLKHIKKNPDSTLVISLILFSTCFKDSIYKELASEIAHNLKLLEKDDKNEALIRLNIILHCNEFINIKGSIIEKNFDQVKKLIKDNEFILQIVNLKFENLDLICDRLLLEYDFVSILNSIYILNIKLKFSPNLADPFYASKQKIKNLLDIYPLYI